MRDRDKYEIIRLRRDDDVFSWTKDSKFQAKFEKGSTLNLIPDIWNGIKLRVIHNRYWVQRNSDWIFKVLITTLMGALIAIWADKKGFNAGYEKGLIEGKSHTQETIRQ